MLALLTGYSVLRSFVILDLSARQLELLDHMFIAMKNMLQHAEIGMYRLTTLPPISTFGTLLGSVDGDQLRLVYFGVHCNISANIYIADFTHILSPTTFKPALRSTHSTHNYHAYYYKNTAIKS